MEYQITGRIGALRFPLFLNDTPAARKLFENVQEKELRISMHNYGGFEFVGELNQRYPAKNRQMTTKPGEIVLYNSDKLVLFTGSNSWSYTPLGKMDDLCVLRQLQTKRYLELILSKKED